MENEILIQILEEVKKVNGRLDDTNKRLDKTNEKLDKNTEHINKLTISQEEVRRDINKLAVTQEEMKEDINKLFISQEKTRDDIKLLAEGQQNILTQLESTKNELKDEFDKRISIVEKVVTENSIKIDRLGDEVGEVKDTVGLLEQITAKNHYDITMLKKAK